MPIDFNQQTFFDPKIDIIGREVPVAELEKTGEIQQKNYDESATNLNKIRELSKQVEQIADPAERQKVRDYVASIQPELEKISSGAIGEARYQTGYLANETGSNLKVIEGRATEIAKIKNKIAEAVSIGDAEARKYYENILDKEVAKTTFDKDRGVFDFKSINMPNIVPNSDNNAFLAKAVASFKADTYGNDATNIKFFHKGEALPDGTIAQNDLAYNIEKKHIDSAVDFTEVYDNVLRMASAEMPLQDHIKRDVQIQAANHLEQTGVEYTPEELLQVKEAVERKLLYNPLTGHANAAAYTDVRDANNTDFNAGATKGNEKPVEEPEVYDVYSSTTVPGEVSNTLAGVGGSNIDNLLDKSDKGSAASVFERYQGLGDLFIDKMNRTQAEFPGAFFKPTKDGKVKLSWSTQGLINKAIELKHSPNADDQLLYDKIMKSGAYQINTALKEGKPLNAFMVKHFQDAVKDEKGINLPAVETWGVYSPTDSRFKTELNIVAPKNKGNTGEQLKELNEKMLGHKEGINPNKQDNWNAGLTMGLSILDPETGQYGPMAAVFNEKGEGLKIKKPKEGDVIAISGKVQPGTVLHATKDSKYGDISYFGAGYLMPINGKPYIVAKHGRDANNSINAKYNDLSGYARVMRDENSYTATGGTYKIKSDGISVFITKGTGYGAKTIPIKNEDFNSLLTQVSATGKDPVDILYKLLFNKK